MDNPTVLFFLEVVRVTGIQLLGIFGIFFGFGFVLSFLQSRINNLYLRSFGWRGILWTAWIGTPFHELGHYFFAKLFRHRIEEVSLFTPNKETGGLGHVEHSYKRRSIYQSVGNFFIGAAPMIWGIGILTLLLYFLHPNGKEILSALLEARHSFDALLATLPQMFFLLFSAELLATWHFWLFLYISFAISAHIAPSKYDRKGMWSGFVWIIVILLIVNVVMVLSELDITELLLKSRGFLTIFTSIALYTFLLSVLHLVFVFLITLPIRFLKR